MRQAYQAAVDRVREITHNNVTNNSNADNRTTNTDNRTTNTDNSDHSDNSQTDNSVNNSNNQQGQAEQPGDQQGVNNSQARVAEDSPRVFLGLATAASKATAGLAAFGVAAVVTTNLIHRWGEGLSERQRYLTEFNGGIAASFAQLEARRIGRNIQRGQGTQASTKYLNTSLDKLEEKLLPYQQVATNLMNSSAAAIIEKLSTGIDILETIAKILLPKHTKSVLEGIMAALGMNAKTTDVFNDSMTKAMIDLANQQPRRRANPPGP